MSLDPGCALFAKPGWPCCDKRSTLRGSTRAHRRKKLIRRSHAHHALYQPNNIASSDHPRPAHGLDHRQGDAYHEEMTSALPPARRRRSSRLADTTPIRATTPHPAAPSSRSSDLTVPHGVPVAHGQRRRHGTRQEGPSPEDLPEATTLTTHHTAQLDSAILVAGKTI
jgi:hypothetical protein